MPQHTQHSRSETGAVLVHTALVLVGLMAMSTFVVDYGLLWAARSQAQSAADAGAMAGAVHLLHDTGWTPDFEGARQTARDVAALNKVGAAAPWVETPDVPCPLPYAGNGCIRVDVFRDHLHDNPLPMVFGAFLGRHGQDVRATATARVNDANASDCIRPFAVPDDNYTVGNLGDSVTIKEWPPGADPVPNEYIPIDFTSGGATTWLDTVMKCSSGTRAIGETLDKKAAPLARNEVDDVTKALGKLYALDPLATYDVGAKRVVGSCAQTRDCDKWELVEGMDTQVPDPARTISPRILVIPVFNSKEYSEGSATVHVHNLLGFFVEKFVQGHDGVTITGRLVTQPGLIKSGGGSPPPEAAFLKTIQLIR